MLVQVGNMTMETGGMLSIRHRNGAEVLLERVEAWQRGHWQAWRDEDGWEVWMGAVVLMGNGPSKRRRTFGGGDNTEGDAGTAAIPIT